MRKIKENKIYYPGFDLIGNKVLPHNNEAEQSVIGGLMLDSTAFRIVDGIIKSPEYFYNTAHQNIYEIMMDMYISGKEIDALTLSEELDRHSLLEIVGGAYYIAEILNKTVTAANIEEHANIVLYYYLKRKQIELGGRIITNGYDTNSNPITDFELLNVEINKLRSNMVINKQKPISIICDEADRAIEELRVRKQKGDLLMGYSTGLKDLDSLLGGFIPGKYIVNGARTSKGKSSLMVSIARNMMRQPEPIRVGILSGEETDVDFITRIALIDAQINPYKFKKMQFSNKEFLKVKRCINSLRTSNLIVNAPNSIRQQDLKSIIRAMVLDEGAQVVFIDHAQKIKLDSKYQGRKQDGYTEVSQTLFSLTRELNVPIMVNAQLNRETENRQGKKPSLSDFKESGAFEEDADIVILIWRPEHDGVQIFDDGDTTKSKAQLLVPKYRGGATGVVTVGFINRYSWFVDVDQVNNPPRYTDIIQEEIFEGDEDVPF